MEMKTETQTLCVSDLRQYKYCPRIVYYQYCLPGVRPVTYKMEAGKAAHRKEEGREQRRSLRAYRLHDGQRSFDVWLEDAALGLRGRVDMVIRRTGEIIPVEYKNSPGRLGKHVILQLTAYGMILEHTATLPAARGFVYYIPARRAREIPLTPDYRTEVHHLIDAMRDMVTVARFPPPTRQRARCEICEFRRFCNDVV